MSANSQPSTDPFIPEMKAVLRVLLEPEDVGDGEGEIEAELLDCEPDEDTDAAGVPEGATDETWELIGLA